MTPFEQEFYYQIVNIYVSTSHQTVGLCLSLLKDAVIWPDLTSKNKEKILALLCLYQSVILKIRKNEHNFFFKRSGKKQTNNNFYKSDDTFEIKFARHVSVVQRPSSVESRINLKLHLNL